MARPIIAPRACSVRCSSIAMVSSVLPRGDVQREVAGVEERAHVFDQRAVIAEIVPCGQQEHRLRGLLQRFGPSLSADTSIYPEAACSPACFMVFKMEPSTSPSIRSMTSRSAGMAGIYETSYETGVDRKSLRRAIS